MLKANFHTHTYRCHHAVGTEREYVEEAIKSGIKTLGFSDHTPYLFENGHIANDKMLPEQLDGYVNTVRNLQREYKKDINILVGLEAEYYPKLFNKLTEFLKPFDLDYLILGQHYTFNETDGVYAFTKEHTESDFITYANQVVEAVKTGYFSYVAHPDVFYYPPNTDTFSVYMEKICKAAKEQDIPVEFNLAGYCMGHWYPCNEFLQIAANVGNKIILGIDAHRKEAFAEAQSVFCKVKERIEKFGLEITDKIKLLNGKTV